jgi:hypothetical protein
MSAIIDMKASKTEETAYLSDKWWNDRLGMKYSPQVPERVKNALKRIYGCYPKECLPQGLSDPMYIMNVIAYELGIGDGQGNFNLPDED